MVPWVVAKRLGVDGGGLAMALGGRPWRGKGAVALEGKRRETGVSMSSSRVSKTHGGQTTGVGGEPERASGDNLGDTTGSPWG